MPGSSPRIVLISSCDRLAALACRHLFRPNSPMKIVGLVRTLLPLKTQATLVRSAIRAGAFFYLPFMFLEEHATAVALRLATCSSTEHPPAPDIVTECSRLGIPVRDVTRINDQESVGFIRHLQADLCLSVRPSVIFRTRMIDAVPPILNFHASLLPDYRGIGGIFQTLASGSKQYGFSIHEIRNEEIDRGPIHTQCTLDVQPGQTLFQHTVRLYSRVSPALIDAVERYTSGKQAKTNEGGSYFSWPVRKDLARFHATGRRLFLPTDIKRVVPDLCQGL
ncbi:MAG: hypothetical protein HQL50_00840 [Magnetococcales bacterium]|nr:hypothetical protein [Magnetococcales bacterium]